MLSDPALFYSLIFVWIVSALGYFPLRFYTFLYRYKVVTNGDVCLMFIFALIPFFNTLAFIICLLDLVSIIEDSNFWNGFWQKPFYIKKD